MDEAASPRARSFQPQTRNWFCWFDFATGHEAPATVWVVAEAIKNGKEYEARPFPAFVAEAMPQ